MRTSRTAAVIAVSSTLILAAAIGVAVRENGASAPWPKFDPNPGVQQTPGAESGAAERFNSGGRIRDEADHGPRDAPDGDALNEIEFVHQERGHRFIKGGEAEGYEDSRRETWRLRLHRQSPTTAVAQWEIVHGQSRRDQPRTLRHEAEGTRGTPLHHDLHGPTGHDLSPAPLILPAEPSPGQIFSGRATGKGGVVGSAYSDYDTTYTWHLEIVGKESLNVPGIGATPVWRVKRHAEDLIDERSGTQPDNTFVIETEELISADLGVPLWVTGRHYVKDNPVLAYNMTFTLEVAAPWHGDTNPN